MLHGYTGDENSMWVFARDLPSHCWIVAPRAPYVSEEGGYSWRPLLSGTLRYARGGALGWPRLEELLPAAEALIRLVDAYSASAGLDVHTFDVMGFSQGAALCNVLAFLHPQRIRKVGILAGFVPQGLEDFVAQRPLEGKLFFVTHGTLDKMVTIDRARASIAILEQAGAQVTYCEDEVKHKVSVACLRAVKDFLSG
jgi:predicted esterase